MHWVLLSLDEMDGVKDLRIELYEITFFGQHLYFYFYNILYSPKWSVMFKSTCTGVIDLWIALDNDLYYLHVAIICHNVMYNIAIIIHALQVCLVV